VSRPYVCGNSSGRTLRQDLRPTPLSSVVLPRAKAKTAGIPGAESVKRRGSEWRSAACQRGDHRGECSSLACSCSCHGPTSVSVGDVKAKDSVLGKGALALLALIAYYAFRQPTAPVNYDLNTYQPEPRTW
jgi:hypothetical protein